MGQRTAAAEHRRRVRPLQGFSNSALYGSVVTLCLLRLARLEIGAHASRRNIRASAALRLAKTKSTPFANRSIYGDRTIYIIAWRPGFHPQGRACRSFRIIILGLPGRSKSPADHPTVKPDLVMNKISKKRQRAKPLSILS